jgi:hypothetical protein
MRIWMLDEPKFLLNLRHTSYMQTSRGVSMEDGQTPFTNWVKSNASTANMLSIIMLIFAAWAAVEIVSNVTGSEIPPVTGMETNDSSKDTQRINNGLIVGLGAVAGTMGLVLQLLIPREESETVVESTPEEDEEIDEVVETMMDEVEIEEEEESEEIEIEVDVEPDEDASDEEDSIEEEDEVPEDEGDESADGEEAEEEEKIPVKKKKF